MLLRSLNVLERLPRLPFLESIIINHRVDDEHEYDRDYDASARDGCRDGLQYRDINELITLWLISESGR